MNKLQNALLPSSLTTKLSSNPQQPPPSIEIIPIDTRHNRLSSQQYFSGLNQTVLKGKIVLNEGISPTNFYSSLLFVLFLGVISITFTTLEPQYISQRFYISDENMGGTTSLLYLIDYSIRLCFALLYGPMIDRFGRKPILTIGVILVSLAYFLVPILNQSLFLGYMSAKSLFSCGIIALQMLPFSADYVDDSTKGIMAAMNFCIAFFGGGIGAAALKLLSYFQFEYKKVYWILAGIVLVMGLVIRMGVKKGNQYYRIRESEASNSEITDTVTKWNEVRKAFKETPWILIAIIFGVLGNTDFYILTTGLVIWVKSLIPSDQDPISITASFQMIFVFMSFILTSILGLKIDKVPHMRMIFPILIFAIIGFIFVPFIGSIESPLLYIFFVIEGATLPGILVYSAYLSYRYNPPAIRGTLSGIGNAIGIVGAIFILSLGGFLHDHWRKDASFLLYAMLLVFTLIVVVIFAIRMRKSNKGDETPITLLTTRTSLADITI